jgi:ubiquinone/menaquinone biosynthesis C-methylase UbiE
MTPHEYMVREGIDLSIGFSRSTMGEFTPAEPGREEYVLATGTAAVHRLWLLHGIYSPAGKRVLLQAGLRQGMRIADFGCGVGATTRMFSEMTGRFGCVTGIDVHAAQLEEARHACAYGGLSNVSFVHADACDTKLPAASFDLVYCRFLLLHLTNPADCLREMVRVLKPGGLMVVEDGDLASAESIPPSAMNAFANVFTKLGPIRGVNYSISRDLFHMVREAGIPEPEMEVHQPAITRGDARFFLKWSVQEAGPALVNVGILTQAELELTLADMQAVVEDQTVLILPPKMSIVWGRKP